MRIIDFNLLFDIINDINNNEPVSTSYLVNKYHYNERTIRRYMHYLKDNNLIKLVRVSNNRKWILTI